MAKPLYSKCYKPATDILLVLLAEDVYQLQLSYTLFSTNKQQVKLTVYICHRQCNFKIYVNFQLRHAKVITCVA